MNRYFAKTQILLLICVLFGCRQNSMDETDGIAVIDVINHLGKYQEIPASEIVAELEYIPLETNNNCLIGAVRNILVTPSYIFTESYVGGDASGIVVSGTTRLYAFSRDGRFICEIGRVGQGPGEYQNMSGFFIDEKKQLVYIETYRTLLEYSWNGVFCHSINKPQNMNGRFIGNVCVLRDNLFIGFLHSNTSLAETEINNTNNNMYSFHLFNESSQVIKSFENPEKIDRRNNYRSGTLVNRSTHPFWISERIYVKEYPNDTLYCLNEQNELIPQFVFNLGKYTFSIEKRRTNDPLTDVLIIPNPLYPMVGTPNYIFFSIDVSNAENIPQPKGILNTAISQSGQIIEYELKKTLGVYDIVNKKTRLLDTDPISRMLGLMNDLDGGLSFWPRYYTSDNELIDVWEAYDMKEILTEEYFAGHTIRNPQSHQNLKNLLKTLKEDDNPVIVIGKLK